MNFQVSQNVYNERNFMVRISAASFQLKRVRVLQVGQTTLGYQNTLF